MSNIQNRLKPILDVIDNLEKTGILNSANNLDLAYDDFTISKDDDIFINIDQFWIQQGDSMTSQLR